MSKASVGAKVGTLIVGAIKGKKSAAATAAAYAKAKASKAAVKAIPKTKLAEPSKASVKVKPAAKQKPNKPDSAKLKIKEHNTRYRAGESAYKQNMKDQTKANYSGYGQGSHGDAVLEANIAQQEARIGRKEAVLKKKIKNKSDISSPANNNTANPFANRVKINTNPTKPKGVFGPLKKKLAAADTPANRAKATNNARGLKAANKPVSKNNRNRFGDGEMSAYLKSTKPARANRTRLGNTANKKGK